VSAVTEQILQDAQRFTWIAGHLSKFNVGFGRVEGTFIDNEGIPRHFSIPFTEEMKMKEVDDADALRHAVDQLSKLS
jgi:hypothetical protein